LRLQVLGCHGGELPKHRTSCFLLDERTTIDAGALCATLQFDDLLRVDDIFLTHSHFDHSKDLPLLADLIVGKREKAVVVRGPPACMRTIADHMFNNSLWPDFTQIPDRNNPVIKLEVMEPYQKKTLGRNTIMSVPVTHPVESYGYIVENKKVSIAFSGDTGPTFELWEAVNRAKNLKAVFLELSFPNKLQSLADISGHLTPRTLVTELDKLDHKKKGVDIYLYHLKPAFIRELKKEVHELGRRELRVLELGDEFEF